jgi:prepilin-type N-terminal cleavage/methylation domain-containing protein
MKDRPYRTRTTDAGFTLIEILVVLGIIATMAAVALPAIGRYIRVYQIQGATQQVASEVQAARVKAIARNVNSGVTFYIYDRNRYWWAMEDLPVPSPPPSPSAGACPSPGTMGAAWQAPLPVTECVALHGAFETLPAGIEFDTAPPSGTPNECKFWFTRLGMFQSARPGPIPSPTPACSGTYLISSANGASITVKQPGTGLHGRIDITSGGRVQVVRSWQ